jgi:tRNA threonylcarbamoyladenosine biosynthesis protein TsaE
MGHQYASAARNGQDGVSVHSKLSAMEDERASSANYPGTMVVSHGPDFAETIVETESAEETREFARRLGDGLQPGAFIALIGPLGAGKTAFVQGLADALGSAGTVTSPTFVLMRLHRGRIPLAHADAYRLEGAGDLADLGLADLMDESVVALEWADTVSEALPKERFELHIEYTDTGRRLHLRGLGSRPARVVDELRAEDDYAPSGSMADESE